MGIREIDRKDLDTPGRIQIMYSFDYDSEANVWKDMTLEIFKAYDPSVDIDLNNKRITVQRNAA